MDDSISRQMAINALQKEISKGIPPFDDVMGSIRCGVRLARNIIEDLPSVQPERLTDDDFETIRIHLNAYKEKLCNQQRWEEADEYQRIIDRFMAFASAQPERKTGRWVSVGCVVPNIANVPMIKCTVCGHLEPDVDVARTPYCSHCGAYMKGEEDD